MKKRFLSLCVTVCMLLSVFEGIPLDGLVAEAESRITKFVAEKENAGEVDQNEKSSEAEIPDVPVADAAEGIANVSLMSVAEDFSWNLSADGVLTVSGIGQMPHYDYTLETVPWNESRDLIKKIVINEGITSIGGYAFAMCRSVHTVSLPESLTDIGFSAFYACTSLTDVDIPDSVTEIAGYAFGYCYALENVDFPVSLEKIYYNCFDNCMNLKNPDMPDSVWYIGYNAFRGCGAITEIVIPKSVTFIDEGTFTSCYSLEKVTMHDNITEIRDSAFNSCVKLESINMPENLNFIGNYAFSYCTSLIKVKLPEWVYEVGERAFGMCSNMLEVKISRSLSDIGADAFWGCNSLNLFDVDKFNSHYMSDSGVLFTKDKSTLIKYPAMKEGAVYEIPQGVTTIANNAFENCSFLKELGMMDDVAEIGESAFAYCYELESVVLSENISRLKNDTFYSCEKLKNVELPGKLQYIEEYVFYGCISISKFEFPNTLRSIGNGAFSECLSLQDINIPRYVSQIGNYAFSGCMKLSAINVDSNNSKFSSSSGILYDKYGLKLVKYPPAKSDTSYIAPMSVSTISEDAFSECIYLKNLNILGTGIKEIPDGMFYECTALNKIQLPPSVETISLYAFGGCYNLKEIVVTEYSEYHSSIDGVLFDKNQNTLMIYPMGKIDEEYFIPKSVKTISDMAFSGCGNLKKIYLNNGCESIGSSSFEYCENLSIIEIPETVTSMGIFAFYGCTNLSEVRYSGSEDAWNQISFAYGNELVKDFEDIVFNAEMTKSPQEETEVATGKCGENAYWNIDINNVMRITGSDAVTEPSGWSGYKESVKEIIVSDGITSICDEAFEYFSALEKVTVADSVTSIGEEAFSNCGCLVSVVLPDNLTAISKEMFFGCTSLKNIVIPESVTQIEAYAFDSCQSLEEIDLHDNIKKIESGAFSNCESLKEIELHDNIQEIGTSIFYECKSLTRVKLPENMTSISSYMFYECTSLNSVNIPDSVKTIDSYAFAGCTVLPDIEFPDELVSIKKSAFNMCDGFNVLEFPEKLTTIEDGSFQGCNNITEINWSESITTIGKNAFRSCDSLETLYIPDNVTSIGDGAFGGCENLVECRLPNGITKLEDNTFNKCPKLEKVILPDSIKSIGKQAFLACHKLQYITIPYGVETIGESAFDYCTTLKEIVIPDSVTNLGSRAFMDCYALEKATLPNKLTVIKEELFSNCDKLISVNIPENVTVIEDRAFYRCETLTYVNIPRGVTSIGEEAFYLCREIKSNIVLDNITYLGKWAFGIAFTRNPGANKFIFNCETIPESAFNSSGMMEIIIKGTVKSINYHAFYSSDVIKVTFESGITKIPKDVFKRCTSLVDVIMADTVTEMDEYVFEECTSLKNVKLSKNLTEIPRAAFLKCESLELKIIPGHITSIGDSAFWGCKKIKSITIPKTVNHLGESAFRETGIKQVIIEDGITTISKHAFCEDSYDDSFATNCSLELIKIPKSITVIERGAIGNVSNDSGSGLKIFYDGTDDEWNSISIDSEGNSALIEKEFLSIGNCTEFQNTILLSGTNADGELFNSAFMIYDYVTGDYIKHVDVLSCENGTLTIEKEGYYPVNISNCSLNFDNVTKISLVPETHGSSISAVHCLGVDGLYNKTEVSNEENELNIYVYSILNETQIKEYQLLQKTTVIDSSKTGIFRISPQLVNDDEPFRVRIIKTDGTKSEIVDTKISVTDIIISFDTDIKIADKLTFKFGDSVPMVGNNTFTLDLPTLPLVWEKDGDTIKVGIGCSKNLLNDESTWMDFKNLVNYRGNAQKKYGEMKKLLSGKYGSVSIAKSVDLSVEAYGYMELVISDSGELKETYGKIAVNFSGSYGAEMQFMVVAIPIVVKGSIGADVNTGLTILGFDFDKNVFAYEGEVEIKVPVIKLSAGIGFAYLGDISVYGSGYHSFKLSVDMDNQFRNKYTATFGGELGASVKVLFFSYQMPIWKGEKTWYHSGAGLNSLDEKTATLFSAKMNEAENYKINRSYIHSQSLWNGKISSEGHDASLLSKNASNNIEQAEYHELQMSVYDAVNPQIVATDSGVKMMVYTIDPGEEKRKTGNHTAVAYSIFNDASSTWSTPIIIDDDGTADFNPSVTTDVEKVYVAWLDSRRDDFDGNTDINELADSCDIVVAVYDAETGQFDVDDVTSNNHFEYPPVITEYNDEIYVVWIENTSADLFDSSGIYNIMYSKKTANGWSEAICLKKSDKPILDISVGILKNQIKIAYTSDTDGNLETVDDVALYCLSMDGSVYKVTSTSEQCCKPSFSVINNVQALVWYASDKLHYTFDLDNIISVGSEVDTISPNYKVVEYNNKTVVISANNNESGSEFRRYTISGSELQDAVTLLSFDDYIDNFSLLNNNGALDIVFSKTNVTFIDEESLEEVTDLCFMTASEVTKINISDIYIDYDDSLKFQEKLPVHITLENQGSVDISEIQIKAEHNGDMKLNTISEVSLGDGESKEIVVLLPIEDIIENNENYIFTVMATTQIGSVYDSAELLVGCTDVYLKVECVKSDNGNMAIVNICNKSIASTNAILYIRKGNANGDIIGIHTVGTLLPGETKTATFTTDNLPELSGKDEVIYFEVQSGGYEEYLVDNYDSVYLPGDYVETKYVYVYGLPETVRIKAENYDGIIYVAGYDNEGKLLDIKSYNAAKSINVDFNENLDLAYAKIMWWSDANMLKPITKAYYVEYEYSYVNIAGLPENVKLKSDSYDGVVYVAGYDNDGKLLDVKSYQPEENLKVEFNDNLPLSYVKIMWWSDSDLLKPVTEARYVRYNDFYVNITGLPESVVLKTDSYDGVIVVAMYGSDNNLTEVHTYVPAEKLNIVPVNSNYKYAKVMWLDNLKSMKPLRQTVILQNT